MTSQNAVAGRPRSEAASRAILDAVLDLVAEHGSIGAITMEAVASRAGTSKATVYRRWSSKEALVAAAVESIKAPPASDLPHESVRDDLVRLLRGVRTDVSPVERRILKSIMVEAEDNPELARQQERLMTRRRRAGIDVIRYWIDQGELRADLDPVLTAAALVSPMLTIMVYGHYPHLRTEDLAERLVDQLLAGIAAN
ncbi:TetR/AcrR family transcriptional regulator [Myceligenerans pegani]|uniref:TetR/AcrR family transcriptional regulator n=1 Tax=Myceligenerans pegani TaxID=2776917 RepID=A0ABR9MXX6_9MICO|nr:TetR/AcrR family transcriptional regulator [Myceligenerans sp. TRM 65318]MBE1875769.1 TetR/AcrR family transcriptional regulator [Myceligenerans sp. TRM 65318]MBE3018040.1 TetR/AcrR family transcriptional regulator [Myceligenerans sp. TRM 65318]